MRAVFYVAIPAAAFLLILANAFFGHLIFTSGTEQVANRYSIYVHLQPEWDSHPNNLIFEVRNSWHMSGEGMTGDAAYNATYNANRLRSVDGKSYVELKHNFSQCRDEWAPVIYKRGLDALFHGIEYARGTQLSADPRISVYPDADNLRYDSDVQGQKIRDGYAQFIPVCSSNTTTSYEYSVRTGSDDIGLDVYFVPSERERDRFYGPDFEHYAQSGCFAKNKKSYSGTCDNVDAGGGLLVVVPDDLGASLTRITVNLYERI